MKTARDLTLLAWCLASFLPGQELPKPALSRSAFNWVPSEHALVRPAYVHSLYSDDVTVSDRTFDDEGALLIEWQLHF